MGVGVNHRQHYGISLTTNKSEKSVWSEKYGMKPISPNDVKGIISPSILRITDEVRLMFSLDVQ